MTEREDGAVVAWTALPAGTDAARIARRLVEERLAACVTVQPAARSVYRWRGAVEDEPQQIVMIKTTRACVAPLRDRLQQLHPDEVPEFVVLPVVDGSPAYLSWVAASVREA